jgi:hypothetical protein
MMDMTQEQYAAFVDGDEDDDLFDLPEMGTSRDVYQIGSNDIPQWVMEAIGKKHVIFKEGVCHTMIKGRYVAAPVGFYLIRMDTYYTIESPRQNQ